MFLRYAAAMNSSSHVDDGKPLSASIHQTMAYSSPPHALRHMGNGKMLSASMHRTMAHRVLPARSDALICCGVLMAANSWIIPVSKQYCQNSCPVYSPSCRRANKRCGHQTG